MRVLSFLFLIFLFLNACAPQVETNAPVNEASKQLQALFDEEWQYRLSVKPFKATNVGVHDYNDQVEKITAEDWKNRAEFCQSMLDRLAEIDLTALDRQDRISADLFKFQMQHYIDEHKYGHYYYPFTSDSGFYIQFAMMPAKTPTRNVKDFNDYIARLNKSGAFFNDHITNLKSGLEQGRTLPKIMVAALEDKIAPQLVEDPTKSRFYRPFENIPASIDEATADDLRARGKEAILATIEAYRTFLNFMINDYMPKTRDSIGIGEAEGGLDYYQHRIRYFTTLDLTPQQIHNIGLSEVKRIRSEMEEIIKQVEFKGDFDAFLDFLRTDPQFYPKSPQELMERAAFLSKKIDAKLPSLFTKLPRQPYGVEPVPDFLAPTYTAGRYVDAALDSGKPGLYWVNTYDLKSRPYYNLEALTLHEAVPGHHLQSALSKELPGLPEFRKELYLSAFGEGWALYAEYLGLEAGFYTDPYANFGRLTYEMWRACRLVVDTGIHAFGWTRQEVVDYLAGNTALSMHEINTETDRYISWPAQALSYKLGEIKIKELRKLATEELGEAFDLREFHDLLLRNGAVTLGILEQEVKDYIAEKKG